MEGAKAPLKRNTAYLALAVFSFLLVGIIQYFEEFVRNSTLQSILTFADHFLLMGLALFWLINLRDRVPPKRSWIWVLNVLIPN